MKKIYILLLLIFCSCSSQKSRTATFTYTWQISDGVLMIKFANTPYGDYSGNSNYIVSTAKFGYWNTNCRQTYLDFIDKLIQYGNLPNRTNGYNDRTDHLEVITGRDFGFILLINDTFETWKLSKPEALILAAQLNQTIWINQIAICPDVPCICGENNKY
jgi:hypothetical protein